MLYVSYYLWCISKLKLKKGEKKNTCTNFKNKHVILTQEVKETCCRRFSLSFMKNLKPIKLLFTLQFTLNRYIDDSLLFKKLCVSNDKHMNLFNFVNVIPFYETIIVLFYYEVHMRKVYYILKNNV